MLIRYIYIRIKHIPSLNQFYIINLINELLPQWLHQLICNQFQLLLKKKGLLFLFQKKKKKKKMIIIFVSKKKKKKKKS